MQWRGFPNNFGQGVDDNGVVINPTNADNEGDIRPAPVLLPTPFSSTCDKTVGSRGKSMRTVSLLPGTAA